MRIYVSGPMSGLPEDNHPAFHAETARLRGLGYEVVNPAELHPAGRGSWAGYLRVDLQHLVTCEVVSLLPGWDRSRGAQLEFTVAEQLGMAIVEKPGRWYLKRLEVLLEEGALESADDARKNLSEMAAAVR